MTTQNWNLDQKYYFLVTRQTSNYLGAGKNHRSNFIEQMLSIKFYQVNIIAQNHRWNLTEQILPPKKFIDQIPSIKFYQSNFIHSILPSKFYHENHRSHYRSNCTTKKNYRSNSIYQSLPINFIDSILPSKFYRENHRSNYRSNFTTKTFIDQIIYCLSSQIWNASI